MAQLKDSVVSGNLRVTGSTLTDTLQTTIIKALTSSSSTTYGPGEAGQVLKSDGTRVYWGADNNSITGSGTSGYLTKWNGTNSITNGPKLGSSTTTFLRNDGEWATPTNTTYGLSGAYGSSNNTWVTTLTAGGSGTTSTVPTSSTSVYGITKLYNGVDSTSTGLAATANAVKTAYDKGNHSHPYLPLAGGTMTGNIVFTAISPSSYPSASKGIYWSGGSDAIDMYYNLRDSDAGELIINMRDDTNVRTSFAYNGTVKSYIDTNGTYNGNATSASKWNTARTLTIGNTGKSVDGSGDQSWSLAEIGAAPAVTGGYLPLSGGTMTGIIKGTTGGNWIQARDKTLIYANGNASTDNLLFPMATVKSKTGAWSIGNVATTDRLYFVYTTDANYSTSTNDAVTTYIDENGIYNGTVTNISTTEGLSDGARPVFYSYLNDNTKLVYHSSFTYNPTGGVLSTKTISRTALKGMITGTGTTAQDKGSGQTNRYVPAKWTFNTGLTVANGDVFIIKIPCAGHTYGVFMSVNNGTNYYPISVNGTARLTTHYGNGYFIAVMFKSDGSTADIYPLAGGDSRGTVSGGCWQVLNYYDSGNSNTYDRNRYNAAIKAGSSNLVSQNIIVGKDGVYNHLKSGGAFDISYPILYLAENVNASATTTNTYDIINFAIATTKSMTLIAYKPVFIRGTLSGTIFTPDSTTWITQTIPTTDDGCVYIYLGNATSTTALYLQERHPIYAFKKGINAFGEITSVSTNALTMEVLRVEKDSRTFAGKNKAIVEEYVGGANYNLPSNQYYNIISIQGNDANYGTQVAFGETVEGAYYRNYNNTSWGSWKSLINTNTTYGISGAYGDSNNNTWKTTLTAGGTGTSSTVPTASTSVYGITKLYNGVDSTSTGLAATANAVKTAYDKGNHSHPYLSNTTKYAGSSSAGGAANSANILNKNATAGATTDGIQYVSQAVTVGSADGNAKEGSNASYKLWSYPEGGTAVSNGVANIQNLRLYWNTSFFRDLFISPNNLRIYHRSVYNGTAKPWRILMDTDNSNPGIKERCYTSTAGAGWFRLMTIDMDNQSSGSGGDSALDVYLTINRSWKSPGPPEVVKLHITFTGTTVSHEIVNSRQSNDTDAFHIFTKYRINKDASSGTKFYIDICHSALEPNRDNAFTVRYEVQRAHISPHSKDYFPDSWIASDETALTNTSTEGVTVVGEVEIPGWIFQATYQYDSSTYYGMAAPQGMDNVWIRTTSQGIIPYESGNSTSGGHSSLGTDSWYFSNAYINRVYGNTADFEAFQARHSNEFNIKQLTNNYSYIWFNYRFITNDVQGYTITPSIPLTHYWFGCGAARTALAKVVTSGMVVYPGAANATNYSTIIQSTTLTANRTVNLPDGSGALGIANILYNTPANSSTTGVVVSALLSEYNYFTIIIGQVGSNAQKTTSAIVPSVAGTHYFTISTVEALGSGGGMIYPAGVSIVQNTSNTTFTLGVNKGISIPSSGSTVSTTSAISAYIKMIIGHKS